MQSIKLKSFDSFHTTIKNIILKIKTYIYPKWSLFMHSNKNYKISFSLLFFITNFIHPEIKTPIIPTTYVQTPSLASLKHSGASVLPTFEKKYSDEAISHNVSSTWVIVASEASGSDRGTYDAFGGRADKGESALETAIRECFEEMIVSCTLGKSLKWLTHYVKNHTTDVVVSGNKKNYYVTYVVAFDPFVQKIKNNFYTALNQQTDMHYKEKDKLAFVSLDRLETVLAHNPYNTNVRIEADVINQVTLQAETHIITLRPLFVRNLRALFKQRTSQKNMILSGQQTASFTQ